MALHQQSINKSVIDEEDLPSSVTDNLNLVNDEVSIITHCLKIADIDRSNTVPSILPCKIIEMIKKDQSVNILYKVASLNGIISDSFSSSDFIDLSETVSADL
ncbi:unnamed protein product [Rotaria sordida]|uniref:Uncharacterized protein n=1 Tax=Rotaria sordida TaxID=392033 RepID=A0A814QD16_9BILA|nr:unnamed protein product [Rotaria sordida]CAF1360306.1 unnamed protein product [Rotaria sordida]CAF3741879.1 unnamed protein product [Rotaria sordida]CAF3798719.1 unnamed protein product [Rotaria sordida]